MKLCNLAKIGAGILFLAFTGLAQVSAIDGDVIGADGKPVKGAEIRISRNEIRGNYHVNTDKKGHYIYNGLPLGTYDVQCVIEGHVMDEKKHVRTGMGTPVDVNFDLKEVSQQNAQNQKAVQEAMQTGQIPKDLESSLTPEQKAALQEHIKKEAEQIKHNAALNEAYNAGVTALDAKQYDQAIEAFNKAGGIDPAQVAIWTKLADAYNGLAATKTGADAQAAQQNALDAFQKAIALKPSDAGLHNNYALSLAKAKKFPEAQVELQKAAELDPSNGGRYYYNLGALETNAGQSDAASASFKKAIDLQPTYADAYFQYGVALVAQAKIAPDGKVTPVPGTVEAFQKYLELKPDGPFADSAKAMLQSMGSSIATSYKNPAEISKKKK